MMWPSGTDAHDGGQARPVPSPVAATAGVVPGIRHPGANAGLTGGVVPAILLPMTTLRMNLHLVSDATGETLNSISRATVSQFEHASVIHHRWSLIRTRFQMHRVLEGIEAEPGPVLSTVIDKALRNELETTCRGLGLPCINVLDPVLAMLQDEIGEQAQARPPAANTCWTPITSAASTPCISCWRMTTARPRPALPKPTYAWWACPAAARRPPASTWPIAA